MFLKSAILLITLASVALAGKSPVFLWGFNSENSPALETVGQEDFAKQIAKELNDSLVIAFLEPELTSDDLSRCEGACHAKLKEFSPRAFLPNVENAVDALRQSAPKSEYVTVTSEGVLYQDVVYEQGKVVFVSFDAPAASLERADLLELHDDVMSTVYNKLAASGKTVALYTRTEGLHRQRRQAEAAPAKPEQVPVRIGNQFLLYFSSFQVTTPNSKEVQTVDFDLSSLRIVNSTTADSKAFDATLTTGDNKLALTIDYERTGYFFLSQISFNDKPYYIAAAVEAPTTFSYYCGNVTFNAKDGSNVIHINSLQFQAPYDANVPENFVFGDAWHCTGFFSIGILSGLFVVVLMLIIVLTGICWLMDINTMDRFDDPKGKTITVAGAE